MKRRRKDHPDPIVVSDQPQPTRKSARVKQKAVTEQTTTTKQPTQQIPPYGNMLGNPPRTEKAKKWMIYEWFYPTLDQGFVLRNEFREVLSALGLGHRKRMKRTEWKAVRKQMGGLPRRFSHAYIKEERDKLAEHRRNVLMIWDSDEAPLPDVALDADGLPRQVPQPPGAGDFVTYIDNGQMKSGILSAVSKGENGCQYHVGQVSLNASEVMVMRTSAPPMPPPLARKTASISPSREDGPVGVAVVAKSTPPDDGVIDVKAVAYGTRLLRRKETLLAELRLMNDQWETALKSTPGPPNPDFRLLYAWMIQQIERVNTMLQGQLLRIRASLPQAALSLSQSAQQLLITPPKVGHKATILSEQCYNAAHAVVESLRLKTKAGQRSDVESEDGVRTVNELVTSCLALLMNIQACSERGLSSEDARLTIEAALSSVKPKHAENEGMYKDIADAVNTLFEAHKKSYRS